MIDNSKSYLCIYREWSLATIQTLNKYSLSITHMTLHKAHTHSRECVILNPPLIEENVPTQEKSYQHQMIENSFVN